MNGIIPLSNCLDIKGNHALLQASEVVIGCANGYKNLSCVPAGRVEGPGKGA